MASEFLQVAQQVFEREKRALSAKEIVNIALREGFFSDKVAGKTPHQTMKAKLSVNIRRLGDASPFVRTAPGRFFLRRLLDPNARIYEAPPLRPPKASEDVLLFPTAWLDEQRRFQGIKTKGAIKLLDRLFRSGELTYISRREAEELDDHKQIITYIMVTRGAQVLAYRRGNYNRVEDFLKGAECVGFGGHVSAGDATLFGQLTFGILEAAVRELKEELELPAADRARLDRGQGLSIVGVLNDDASANGRRHFAVILRYEVSGGPEWDQPIRNEKAITQLRWLDPTASPERLFDFEYWSQLCILEFYRSAQITRPTYVIRRKPPLRPPHLLLVLGELGSGKSATTRLLRSDFSYTEINSGRVVAELLGVQPLDTEQGRAAFQDKAWSFIQSADGPSRLAEALLDRADQIRGGRVLIEGIRQRATLKALLGSPGDRRIGTVFIHTPFNVAFEFYRHRAGGMSSIYEFIAARGKPVELEVGGLVEFADAVLYNWSGEGAYKKMIHRLMADLGVTP
jgi:predicted NUDIX family phosphoesterase